MNSKDYILFATIAALLTLYIAGDVLGWWGYERIADEMLQP